MRNLMVIAAILLTALQATAAPSCSAPLNCQKDGKILNWNDDSTKGPIGWECVDSFKGDYAGYCTMAWKGVEQPTYLGPPLAPAYFDDTEDPTCGGWPNKYAPLKCKIGCSCPPGWLPKMVGVCGTGLCTDPAHGGTSTDEIYIVTCLKLP